MRVYDFSRDIRKPKTPAEDVALKNELAAKVMCDERKSIDGDAEAEVAGSEPAGTSAPKKAKKTGKKD